MRWETPAIRTCTRTSPPWSGKGLLIRVQRPINKDTEMHPLVRWQFRGGIPEVERKAFLFENVVDSTGRKYDIPVAVGILASNREIYSVGIGCNVDNIKQKWDHAEQHPVAPVLIDNPPCQEIVVQGDGAESARQRRRRAADPDFHAGLRQCALCVLLDVHHQGSRYRAAEHRQLPRHGQKPDPDGNESRRSSSTRASTNTFSNTRRAAKRCRWR